MSKAEVKKYIKSLERDSLEELVMDLYSARKEAKEYLEYIWVVHDVSLSQRNISFLLFRRSLIYVRLRLNNL